MKKSQTIRTLVAAGCIVSSGCVSGPQQRPRPKPAECPDGAAMTHERFGLLDEDHLHGASLIPLRRGIEIVQVREGDVTADIIGPWGKLRDHTTFSGRLYFGTAHVYGRFTKATLPGGEVVPVCFEMILDHDDPGVPMEPESTPRKVLITSSITLKRVERFE